MIDGSGTELEIEALAARLSSSLIEIQEHQTADYRLRSQTNQLAAPEVKFVSWSELKNQLSIEPEGLGNAEG